MCCIMACLRGREKGNLWVQESAKNVNIFILLQVRRRSRLKKKEFVYK